MPYKDSGNGGEGSRVGINLISGCLLGLKHVKVLLSIKNNRSVENVIYLPISLYLHLKFISVHGKMDLAYGFIIFLYLVIHPSTYPSINIVIYRCFRCWAS